MYTCMLCMYDSFDHFHILICAEKEINHHNYYHFGAGLVPYINIIIMLVSMQ